MIRCEKYTPIRTFMPVMRAINLIVVCLALAGVSVKSAAEAAHQEPMQAAKPPIQFKLVRGEQYRLCKDYVEMLNKTAYTELPVCERTMLPGFDKFRAVQWNEITDKTEVRRLVLEKIRLLCLTGPVGCGEKYQKLKSKAESEMDAGKYDPVYESKIDLDSDGKGEIVYRFYYVIFPKGKTCQNKAEYLAVRQDVEGDDKYMYMKRGRYSSVMLGLGNDRLFYYDGRTYVDYWDVNRLEVAEIDKRSNAVCSVNVIQ